MKKIVIEPDWVKSDCILAEAINELIERSESDTIDNKCPRCHKNGVNYLQPNVCAFCTHQIKPKKSVDELIEEYAERNIRFGASKREFAEVLKDFAKELGEVE